MNRQTRPGPADSFADAWAALVRHDQDLTAPADLDRRVLVAVRAHQAAHARKNPNRRWWLGGLSLAAAGVVLAAAAILLRTAPSADIGRADAGEAAMAAPATATDVIVVPEAPLGPAAGGSEAGDAVFASAPLVALAIDDVSHTESLQLVRVRMPRAALGTLGVALYDPEATGMVDVGIVVGDDGLPRDIRLIRSVIANIEE